MDTKPVFSILDKYTCNKNQDRVRFLSSDMEYLLSASYHLNKENSSKSGGLHLFKIIEGKIQLINEIDLEYGVLDYKFDKCTNSIITSNSDCSFSIFQYEVESTDSHSNHLINFKSGYKLPCTTLNNDEVTCNTLDISNVEKDNTILFAMNDGYHHIFDLKEEKTLASIKSHEYGLWSCTILDEHLYLTGSEDGLLKIWDRRMDTVANVNKDHTASVNCILKDVYDKNNIFTGSYDENLTIIDIRKFNSCIKRQNLGHSLWDMKQEIYKDKRLLLIASIYEGFNIISISKENEIEKILSVPLAKDNDDNQMFHKAIVYGVDSRIYQNELTITSCSFYDNLILLWKFF
jgi:WD40 repeat protein